MKNLNLNRASDTSVITLGDLMRIRDHIIPPKNEEEEAKYKEEQLKQKSTNRMRQWPDSLEMAKKNQLEARKKIFFEQEV